MNCPKCHAKSGDDWSQCHGVCPMPGSPHYDPNWPGREDNRAAPIDTGCACCGTASPATLEKCPACGQYKSNALFAKAATAAASAPAPRWTYVPWRASLYLDGKRFAIVSPDGANPLSEEQVKLLLGTLNK